MKDLNFIKKYLKYLGKDAKILIVGAGIDDFELFKNNFINFTCSNLGGKRLMEEVLNS